MEEMSNTQLRTACLSITHWGPRARDGRERASAENKHKHNEFLQFLAMAKSSASKQEIPLFLNSSLFSLKYCKY